MTKKNSVYEPVGEKVRIFQRGSMWYANYQWNGRQNRDSLKTRSKKEAVRRALVLDQEIRHGKYKPDLPPAMLAEAVAAYMAFLKTELRANKTLVKYRQILARLQVIAKTRRVCNLLGIDLRFLDRYREQRVEEGAAPKTIYTESVIIRQLINFALRRRMIAEDPLQDLTLSKPKPTEQPCWTAEEIEAILAASREPERSKFLVLGTVLQMENGI